MKNANEVSTTCSMFKDNMRAFIDDELPVNIQSVFLKHSSECTSCNHELRMMQNVKKALSNLEHVSVSPEFDFRMKSSIRREYELLRNPFYVFKIIIFENIKKFITVPAVAVLVIAGIFFYTNYGKNQMMPVLPVEVISQIDDRDSVELGFEDENADVDEVRYVLETVKPLDDERGIFLNEPDYTIHTDSVNENLTLVGF